MVAEISFKGFKRAALLIVLFSIMYIDMMTMTIFKYLAPFLMHFHFSLFLNNFVDSLHFSHGVNFYLSGPELSPNDAYVLISNHKSALDWIYVFALSNLQASFLRRLKVSLHRGVKKLPCFGSYAMLNNYCFLNRNWNADKEILTNYFKDPNLPKNIIFCIYPEGCIFDGKNIDRSKKFQVEHGLLPLKHLLYPKHRGLMFALKGMYDDLLPNTDNTISHNEPTANSNIKICDINLNFIGDYPISETDILFKSDYSIFMQLKCYTPASFFSNCDPESKFYESSNEEYFKEALRDHWYEKDLNMDRFHKNSMNEGFDPEASNYVKIKPSFLKTIGVLCFLFFESLTFIFIMKKISNIIFILNMIFPILRMFYEINYT